MSPIEKAAFSGAWSPMRRQKIDKKHMHMYALVNSTKEKQKEEDTCMLGWMDGGTYGWRNKRMNRKTLEGIKYTKLNKNVCACYKFYNGETGVRTYVAE